jgi:hypothetical protein
MTIENRRQLENTRLKLAELQGLFATTKASPTANEHVKELTLRSIAKRINQFKEEIARFETHATGAATPANLPPKRPQGA